MVGSGALTVVGSGALTTIGVLEKHGRPNSIPQFLDGSLLFSGLYLKPEL